MSAVSHAGLLWIVAVYLCLSMCHAQQVFKRQVGPSIEWDRDNPCRYTTQNMPAWCHFQPNVVVRTLYGDVQGFNIPWHIDDLNYDPVWHEKPPNVTRRINCFLGVPYASPPIGQLRFKRPVAPRWGGQYWDASYYRPACPQPRQLTRIRREIPDFSFRNVSEDCLYLNIFAPNYTIHNDHYQHYRHELWPVLVWFNSGTFEEGAAQTHPGHVLATQEIVVVTINCRLGALGFMSTQDEQCSGNWGLFDQQKALEFVKQNIKAFKGDPDRITIAGDGAGAASVGYHMLSDMSRGKGFFHRCIMMSGTDLSYSLFMNPYWRPREYALDLAELCGCDTDDTYRMMDCMRDVPWERIVDLQEVITPKNGIMGVVWAPTPDGGWWMDNPNFPQVPYLRYQPRDMRQMGMVDKLPCIIGLNTQDGVETALKYAPYLERGLLRGEQQHVIAQMIDQWEIEPMYRERVLEAVEFQYTHWPDPENNTARGQEFINYITDLEVGMGMDEVLKDQSQYEAQWMYQFNYNSWNNWLPDYMGVAYSQAVPYIFGVPFMNETKMNESRIVPHQLYEHEDRNMSEWMMYMWTNFVKEGSPTPNITRNITWDPFNYQNLSYLKIDHHSHIWFRYRQEKYSFWSEYFPEIAKQELYFATPTPAGFEYVIATGGMSALVIVLWCLVGFMCILLWLRSKEDRYMQEFPEYEMPTSFMTGTSRKGSQSQISQSAFSGYQPSTSAYHPSSSTYHPSSSTYHPSSSTNQHRGQVNPSASLSGSSGGSDNGRSPPYKPQYPYKPVASNRSGYIGHSVC